jgi:ABC-type branched-subunit amino acid transport system substrate-binding protein
MGHHPLRLGWIKATTYGAVGALLLAMPAAAQDKTPLKMGILQSLSGPVAPYGISGKVGAEMAIQEINAKGGIAGRKIEAVVADSQGTPSVAVSELNRLIQRDKIDVTLNPMLSIETLAIQPILKQSKMLGVGISNAAQLTPDVAPYTFMAYPSATGQAKIMADFGLKGVPGAKTAALIGDNGAGSKLGMQILKKELTDRGVNVTGVQEYAYASTDVVPQLLDLRRANPDILFQFASLGQDTAAVMKGLQDVKWDIKVYSTLAAGMTGDVAVKMAGVDAMKNLTAMNFRSFSFCPGDKDGSPAENFIARINKFSPELEGKIFYAQASLYYDAVYLVKAAVEASGGKTDGPTLAEWIETKSGSFKGVTMGSEASKTNHFLVGFSDIAPTKIEVVKGEGKLQQRADCK